MSATVSTMLKTRKPEDLKQLSDFAIELTREWSLKTLGYDIADRDEDRDQFNGFIADEEGICWYDFYGSGMADTNMPIATFIKQIVERFPQMELVQYGTSNGPCVYRSLYRNGEWKELKQYTMDVYVEKDADFSALAHMINDKMLLSRYNIKDFNVVEEEHFLMLTFDDLTEEEQDVAFNGIVDEMSQMLPQVRLFCVLVLDEAEGNGIEQKAIVKDGALSWKTITLEEIDHLKANSDFVYGDNEPKAEYVKLLFDKEI